tara:strand:- start:1099 stop:1371 length:273 start_codon:yes stop_codon:yes gene_type:complete
MKDNKLIAEFMDMQETNLGWVDGRRHILNDDSISPLLYHTSWDWLMPVVEKIYQLELDNEGALLVRDAVAEANLNNTYQAVVEFIEWYNK